MKKRHPSSILEMLQLAGDHTNRMLSTFVAADNQNIPMIYAIQAGIDEPAEGVEVITPARRWWPEWHKGKIHDVADFFFSDDPALLEQFADDTICEIKL